MRDSAVEAYSFGAAVQLAKAGRISLLFYIQVSTTLHCLYNHPRAKECLVQMPLTMTLSYVVFGDALNMLGWTGSLVIVGTSLAVAFSKEEDSRTTGDNYLQVVNEDEEHDIAMTEEPIGSCISTLLGDGAHHEGPHLMENHQDFSHYTFRVFGDRYHVFAKRRGVSCTVVGSRWSDKR
jgi:hypothetical protein